MNTTIVKTSDLSENMLLDEDLGIIAAGPIVSVNCGLFGTKLVRAVFRKSKSAYVINIQRIDEKGKHQSFDYVTLADQPIEDYRKANKAFRRTQRWVDNLGYGYHDFTSS